MKSWADGALAWGQVGREKAGRARPRTCAAGGGSTSAGTDISVRGPDPAGGG